MTTHVAIVFGGKSKEHKVSLLSTRGIVDEIDRYLFTPHLFRIDEKGMWFASNETLDYVKALSFSDVIKRLACCDVAFPVLHGPFGEDGKIQGFFETIGIPYVGEGVLSSAINMDKDVTKRLLVQAGINVPPFLVSKDSMLYDDVVAFLGYRVVIKPCNMGSSIGISKVSNKEEFEKALAQAFLFDEKVIIEKEIIGREIECSVLGINPLKISCMGEIIPKGSFYSFDAKYVDAEGAQFILPAPLTKEKEEEMKEIAKKAVDCLLCKYMARIDFFLDRAGIVYLNEINTIPGFTKISLYPKLLDLSGFPYKQVITELIFLAKQEKTSLYSHLTSN